MDPEVDLLINDYQIVSQDLSQCFVELVKDTDIDFIGVQSHMKAMFSGDIVMERFDNGLKLMYICIICKCITFLSLKYNIIAPTLIVQQAVL